MMKRVLVILSVVCVGLLQPGTSEAGLADFIWGLSGPQMIGFGFGCRWGIYADGNGPRAGQPDICQWGVGPASVRRKAVKGEAVQVADQIDAAAESSTSEAARFSYSVGGSIYTSTGKDGTYDQNRTADFKAFRTWMLALEPSLSVRSFSRGNYKTYHGIGPTLAVGFGERFTGFANVGIKVTAWEQQFLNRGLSVSAVLRYFPRGFIPQDFGVDIGPVERRHELTWGIGFGFFKPRCDCSR